MLFTYLLISILLLLTILYTDNYILILILLLIEPLLMIKLKKDNFISIGIPIGIVIHSENTINNNNIYSNNTKIIVGKKLF